MADTESGTSTDKTAAARPANKRAVVLIHGMGNQSPMATLRGFVEAVWTTDDSLGGEDRRETWAVPDTALGSHELKRITTRADGKGIRTDFFEFYWAHLVHSTQLSSVLWWVKHLLWRPLRRVPAEVRSRWFLAWAAMILLALAVLWMAWSALALVSSWFAVIPVWAHLASAVGLGGLLWFLRHRILIEVVGDAARYLTASPENIAARAAIRDAGVRLVRELHGGAYDRIIIAGHSLGSVIGYDILTIYWTEVRNRLAHDDPASLAALDAIEKAAAKRRAKSPAPLAEYRNRQREYARKLDDLSGGRWRISDFVTLGSPLAHAHFLLVDDSETPQGSEIKQAKGWLADRFALQKPDSVKTAFERVATLFGVRASQREFPVAPPQTEAGDEFSYRPEANEARRLLHHAAPFAPVRWTNIFAKFKRGLRGDPIGGPVAPLFGPGVKDVPLEGGAASGFVAHGVYWQPPSGGSGVPPHITALRNALNLADEDEV
jgi:hypothetical protein